MKLALIGKNISHSKSPETYKEILGDELLSYQLLDYPDEFLIPPVKDLFLNYDGISITSPYKKHFLSQIKLVNCPEEISGINVMRFMNNIYEGSNTDFSAIKSLLHGFQDEIAQKEIVILGDGVMSQITELVLQELNINYKIYSRKKTKNFAQLTFANNFIINTCSRNYIFSGIINENVIFWDYNYNFFPHENSLPSLCEQYIDGLGLLKLQAKYAVQFWSGSNCLKSL